MYRQVVLNPVSSNTTFQITTEAFTAGIIVNPKGKVKDTDKQLSFMKGWHIEYVDYYVNQKGWLLQNAER